MPQFAIVDGDGELLSERFTDIDAAVAAASKIVSEEPGNSIDVIQLLKTVTSEVTVIVEDVK